MVEARTGRQQERLREQQDTIHDFLRGVLTDDDRAAISLGGEPPDWDPDREVHLCVPTCDHGVHNPETPGWETIIDRVSDREIEQKRKRFPRYLHRNVYRALSQLPWNQAAVLHFHCRLRWEFYGIAKHRPEWSGRILGYSDRHLIRLHDQGLERLARACWDEAGNPRYC